MITLKELKEKLISDTAMEWLWGPLILSSILTLLVYLVACFVSWSFNPISALGLRIFFSVILGSICFTNIAGWMEENFRKED